VQFVSIVGILSSANLLALGKSLFISFYFVPVEVAISFISSSSFIGLSLLLIIEVAILLHFVSSFSFKTKPIITFSAAEGFAFARISKLPMGTT
jgi:hypothetical protein